MRQIMSSSQWGGLCLVEVSLTILKTGNRWGVNVQAQILKCGYRVRHGLKICGGHKRAVRLSGIRKGDLEFLFITYIILFIDLPLQWKIYFLACPNVLQFYYQLLSHFFHHVLRIRSSYLFKHINQDIH